MTDKPQTIGDAITERLRHAHTEYLDSIRQQVNELIALPTPDDSEVADIVGVVRALEVKLGDWRRGLEDAAVGRTAASDPEQQHAAAGVEYRLVPTVKIERTYNTPRILSAVADASGQSLTQVILSAIDAKAMKLEWSYRAMVKWVKRNGATVTTASGVIPSEADLDEPMIREIEKAGRPTRVAVGVGPDEPPPDYEPDPEPPEESE